MAAFDPASVVAELDRLGLELRCTRLPNGTLAFAPWNGAGGPQAQRMVVEACQSSANRVALLAYLQQAGRVAPEATS